MSDQTPPRCYLLEVPRELRLEIYEYLLKPWKITIRSLDSPTILVPASSPHTTRFYASVGDKTLHPHTLRLCRTIHSEAKPFLLKPTILSLKPSCNNSMDLSEDSALFPLPLLSHITVLPILELDLGTLIRTADEDVAHTTLLAKHLSNPDLRIRSLQLVVVDYSVFRENYGPDELTSLSDLRKLLAVWKAFEPLESFNLELCMEGDGGTQYWKWVRKDGSGWEGVVFKEGNRRPADYTTDRRDAVLAMVEEAFEIPEKESTPKC